MVIARKRYVVQPHGMVMPDRRLRAKVLDRLWVRKILADSSTVFALTEQEAAGLAIVGDSERLTIVTIANGIRAREKARHDTAALKVPQVLFLARLHPRKRVLAFAEMAMQLITSGVNATFHVVGPDEGDLARLMDFASRHDLAGKLSYEGAIPAGAGADRIAEAAVYVLPSTGEVFPMTVLEAISVGTPVVLTYDCGMAPELARRGAAMVVGGAPDELAAAVSALLFDPGVRDGVLDAADNSLHDWLSIGAVARRLLERYESGDETR
jgi:glycosyltransferase involved in cell wall biosynthesis